MKGSKKCPNCGQWSVWTHDPDERCEHCHHLLAPEAQARQQAQEERREEEKQRFTVDFIKIDPDDHWFLRFWKRIGLGFQIAFVSIVTFLIWLIAFLAA